MKEEKKYLLERNINLSGSIESVISVDPPETIINHQDEERYLRNLRRLHRY